jgi:capsular exopolysaccharide synthesis family protein
MSASDVWRVIRSNLWLILVMLILSVAGGFALNWYLARYHSSFTAFGYIEVNNVIPFSIKEHENLNTDATGLALNQKTQAALLSQDALFITALQDPNADIRKTKWWSRFHGDISKAKEDLGDHYSVRVIPESKLIEIRMSYSEPKDCRTIVEDIVNKHLENQKTINQNEQLKRSVVLNNLKQRYQFRKEELGRDLREKAARLNIDGMGVPGRLSAKEIELQNLMETQFDMSKNAADAASAYNAAMGQVQDGVDLPNVQKDIAADTQVQFYRQKLTELDMQVGQLDGLGSNHSALRGMKQARDDMQKKLDDAIAEVRSKSTADMIERLRQQKDLTDAQMKGMQEKIDAAKADLGDLTNAMNQYLTTKDDEQTTRDLLKQVDDQLEQIQQTSSTDQSPIQWATHPEIPDTPSFPKLGWVVSLSTLAGLAIALGIAFTRELMDTSVRSPRDIARVGQLNLLGIIPHEDEDPQAAGAPLPQVIFQAPHSMMAEQYRQVRSRLQHAASLDSTRSLMVTSPSPGDGKTTVACNLAAGLALNGRRILLVDANFRRPELHKIFGLPNDAGFSAVLNSIDNFSSAVCQTQVPNLDVLPSGPRPTNSTELIESQLLIDLIERALEEYDHVIFDSGPFLFVSESVALAPRVDGVITVVKARANSRGLLQRMRDELRKTKAEHLGIVLNAVRAQAGGYYNRNIKTYYAYQSVNEA